MSARLTESCDEQVWELDGRSVTLLLIDRGGFRFRCWTLDGDVEVRFGSQFAFHANDGGEFAIDSEHPGTIAPLLNLIHTGVIEIRVQRAGDLAVSFADASNIRAWPHPDYEAWEITGEGELSRIRYLCAPDGGSPWG